MLYISNLSLCKMWSKREIFFLNNHKNNQKSKTNLIIKKKLLEKSTPPNMNFLPWHGFFFRKIELKFGFASFFCWRYRTWISVSFPSKLKLDVGLMFSDFLWHCMRRVGQTWVKLNTEFCVHFSKFHIEDKVRRWWFL